MAACCAWKPTIASAVLPSGAHFTTASASSRALRRRSRASSISTGDKDAALAKRPMNQRARHALAPCRLLLGDYDDIDWYPQRG